MQLKHLVISITLFILLSIQSVYANYIDHPVVPVTGQINTIAISKNTVNVILGLYLTGTGLKRRQ